ncbi:hypothetical protein [Phycicoccus avicenniae]|uniref:hypothetical protein n=1 Tax=Phycicoccus avicenniae TaxID=2828860 RepID=UPI003D2994D8
MSVVAAGGILLGGCGVLPSSTAGASWSLAPGQEVTAASTELQVLVTRVGCNSGVTGTAEEPTVDVGADRVVVTFVVTPEEPGSADCQGNPEVPFTLLLPEPLGARALVDGQCLGDGEAAGTSFCADGGLRYEP